jgi:beta-glucosidase
VVVLESGGPDLTPWRAQVGALLEAWYAGGPGGKAVADVLFGKVDPGGRLPVTLPAEPSQIPTAGDPAKYPGIGLNVYYKEGVLVGYRWYDAHDEQPAFPFGYGLSYTRFRFSRLRITRTGRRRYRVTVRVANVGRRTGSAVVELYVGIPGSSSLLEPPKQLKAFAKLSLRPRRHRTVTMKLNAGAFSYWSTASQAWRIAPGCDRLMVGSSSRELPLRHTVCPSSLPGQ